MSLKKLFVGSVVLGVFSGCLVSAGQKVVITGELKKWHTVTVTFDGPATSENAVPNPFLYYRLDVTFTNGDSTYTIPGFYAADGDAANTSAAEGNKWRVRFTPDKVGRWTYKVSFRKGENVAISDLPEAGEPAVFDGAYGTFETGPTDKTGQDFRGKGKLGYVGQHYLRFAETGQYFIKGGADSPENFLAYFEFDSTFDTAGRKREGEADSDEKFLHRYEPHARDWRAGDPVWKDGKGKNIIGALNYLAGKGMNSVYFITYNIDGGDGRDVWPWTGPDEKLRFDCSKLDQWEIVFSH
ncbi:MAG TPA: DUF5060 domain-containing protein, partial [Sedimentisphaerales bacterium]|nr:DUF5060 domain-containing protein [Sedimentisphaerales bacterium]